MRMRRSSSNYRAGPGFSEAGRILRPFMQMRVVGPKCNRGPPRPSDEGMTCAECGYDLRGLPPDSACPECGRVIAESEAAAPVRAWLPGFRRGVACLAGALLVLPFAEQAAYGRMRWLGNRVNPDGLTYLLRALLLLPAAWWMTGAAPFLSRDPRRLRPWLIGLTVAQLAAAALATALLPFAAHGSVLVLLCTYALAPLPFIAEVALLLALLARPLRIVPGALPRWVVIPVACLFVASLLGPALGMAALNFARIGHIAHPLAPGETYLPAPLNQLLNDVLFAPAFRVRGPAWLACLLVVGHTLLRLRGPVGLPLRKVQRPG